MVVCAVVAPDGGARGAGPCSSSFPSLAGGGPGREPGGGPGAGGGGGGDGVHVPLLCAAWLSGTSRVCGRRRPRPRRAELIAASWPFSGGFERPAGGGGGAAAVAVTRFSRAGPSLGGGGGCGRRPGGSVGRGPCWRAPLHRLSVLTGGGGSSDDGSRGLHWRRGATPPPHPCGLWHLANRLPVAEAPPPPVSLAWFLLSRGARLLGLATALSAVAPSPLGAHPRTVVPGSSRAQRVRGGCHPCRRCGHGRRCSCGPATVTCRWV